MKEQRNLIYKYIKRVKEAKISSSRVVETFTF